MFVGHGEGDFKTHSEGVLIINYEDMKRLCWHEKTSQVGLTKIVCVFIVERNPSKDKIIVEMTVFQQNAANSGYLREILDTPTQSERNT